MASQVTKEEIAAAHKVSVYDYAMAMLPDAFKKEGTYLRLKADHKITVSRNRSDYFDNGTGRTGDGIDLLTRFFGYSLPDAVQALNSFAGVHIPEIPEAIETRSIELPAPAAGRYKQLYAYLMSRGISADMINYLVKQGLLYQSEERRNAVFVNRDRNYAEVRGTYTYGKPFKQSIKEQSNLYWCVPGIEAAEAVFVCEAAIDAISLAMLRKQAGCPLAVYASIGGAANYGTIETIIRTGKHIVLAVDNDEAGQKCRDRFPALEYTIPVNKDWNDDLTQGVKYHGR